MTTARTVLKAATSAAWWCHNRILRLLWSPEAPCPVPHNGTRGRRGRWAVARAGFRRSPGLYLGGALLGTIVLLGMVGPLLSPYPADLIIPGARLQPPSAVHPFGTDPLGRDLFSRVASGAHLAFRMGLLSVGISLALGLVLGSLAGFYSRWVDQVISRTMDGWLALPGALVAVVIVARLGASLDNLILALGIMGVPAFYRIVRNSTLSARRMPYVEAAVALGATDGRVMWRHVFPNILSPLVVLTTMRLGTALLTGSSLSFIGLGAQPPMPEWGALLATARNYLDAAWWLAVFPGLAVTVTVVGLSLMGDGLRDLLDPRLGQAVGPGEVARAASRPVPPAQPPTPALRPGRVEPPLEGALVGAAPRTTEQPRWMEGTRGTGGTGG